MPPVRTRRRRLEALIGPFQDFLRLEAASGILLLLSAGLALVWANLHPPSYDATFDGALPFATPSLRTWINEGLMALFFFVVGMEIKRELVVGELDSVAKATLPVIAAMGGSSCPPPSSWPSMAEETVSAAGGFRWRRTSPSASGS